MNSRPITTLATVLVALAAVGTTSILSAAPPRKPRPIPAPAPIPTVAPPTSLVTIEEEATRIIFSIDPGSGFEHQTFISGPDGGNGIVSSIGPVASSKGTGFGGLVPDSNYVIRAKRIAFTDPVTKKRTAVTSAFSEFRIHTPTLADSRPTTPVLTQGGLFQTAGGQPPLLTISFDPSLDENTLPSEMSYVYQVNGGPELPTCSQYCFGATGVYVRIPSAGTRITVYAIDNAGIRSLPGELTVAY